MRGFRSLFLIGVAALAQHAACSQAADSRVSVLTGAQVIQILDDTVEWYRALGTPSSKMPPSPAICCCCLRIVRRPTKSSAWRSISHARMPSCSAVSLPQRRPRQLPHHLSRLPRQQAALDADFKSVQQEIANNKQKLATAAKDKPDIEGKLLELQGELAMVGARKNLLDTMGEVRSQQ